MSTASRKRLRPEEYLAIETASEFRHEFFDGEMFAMSGGSLWHNLVKDNFARAIGNALEGRGCYVLTSDQRVKVDATGLYTYPNVVVFCEKPRFEDDVHYSLTNPRVIIEVLSDSTEAYNRGRKFAHYRTLPSLQEYLLVAQDHVSVERFERQADDDTWTLTAVTEPNGSVALASLDATVAVSAIYAGVEFPPSQEPRP
jgi:Uma2 family endonuclease